LLVKKEGGQVCGGRMTNSKISVWRGGGGDSLR